jgi:hypothetical protein
MTAGGEWRRQTGAARVPDKDAMASAPADVVTHPVEPVLARLVDEIPAQDGFLFEPK